VVGAICITARDANPGALAKQCLGNTAAKKTAAAKNRNQLALHICSVVQRDSLRALCTSTGKLSRPTCVKMTVGRLEQAAIAI